MGDITDNFSEIEFTCKCGCGTTVVDDELLEMAQAFRDYIGKPMVVHCTVRCESHNRRVKGEPNSFHLPGRGAKAMDFHVRGLPISELHRIARDLWKQKEILSGGLGVYDWGLHIDSAGYRTWNG